MYLLQTLVIIVFKSLRDTGMFIRKWGSFGSGNGEFRFPSHVAVHSSGNVFVADFGDDRIQKFTNTGQFIRNRVRYPQDID